MTGGTGGVRRILLKNLMKQTKLPLSHECTHSSKKFPNCKVKKSLSRKFSKVYQENFQKVLTNACLCSNIYLRTGSTVSCRREKIGKKGGNDRKK
jgi:hypothetical protein